MGSARLTRISVVVAATITASVLFAGCASTADARPLSRSAPSADAAGEALAAATYVVGCVPDDLVQRPGRYVLACGDGHVWLEGLTWTGWGDPTASAAGTLVTNACDPTCVNGTNERRSVTVALTDLVEGEGAATYRTLTVTHGTDRPDGVPATERFDLQGIAPGDVGHMADGPELTP